MKIWNCKIGEIDSRYLKDGADLPMREAVRKAYTQVTGQEPLFIFSGWAGQLTEAEREAYEPYTTFR